MQNSCVETYIEQCASQYNLIFRSQDVCYHCTLDQNAQELQQLATLRWNWFLMERKVLGGLWAQFSNRVCVQSTLSYSAPVHGLSKEAYIPELFSKCLKT
jgi:hypothetical protein